MAVKIRLARFGAKGRPYYKIVVANATSPRNGKVLERIGNYDPMIAKGDPKRYNLNMERFSYWVSCGAQPTDIVAKIVKRIEEHSSNKDAAETAA